MPDKKSQPEFSKTVTINASPSAVWAALTDPQLMQQWMAEFTIDIVTNWQVGSPLVVHGELHGKPFENRGAVLAFEKERLLSYSHLSSSSRLPDEPASYSIITFALTPAVQHTALALIVTNAPSEVIYKHLAYYWNVALEVLKQFIEKRLIISS